MPALSQSLLQLGSSFLTARAAHRLRRVNADLEAQERTLRDLLTKLGTTAYGGEFGLKAGMPYEQFRQAAPLRMAEHFDPFIERMKMGEADVLWPGQCAFFATAAGSTGGRVRHLPITEDMLRHFRRAVTDSILYYTARVGHSGVFRGRHLFLGGTSVLAALDANREESAFAGNLSGITTLNLPAWVERYLFEPGLEIARMEHSPAKTEAIARRTLGRDITLLAGAPEALLGLAAAVGDLASQDRPRPKNLQEIWPNLECVVHGYAPLDPFAETLRAAAGPNVDFHEVYPSPEGFIAAQDAAPADGLRLMTDAGLFFEFLPLREYDEARLETLGSKAVPLGGVQPGIDYVLVLTTPAGLCRYVPGDVVRFVSTKPPRVICVGNTRRQLNTFGELVTERELTDSLVAVCRRQDWTITNFHIAPKFLDKVTGQVRGHHEWWVELQPPTMKTPTGPAMARELDAELQQRNADYASRRDTGVIADPVVRLVMPGVFEQWMRAVGCWGGECRMTRCRSDRLIADELARLARFST